MNLDAALLVRVLSHLPQRQRVQAMSVSKPWNKAVREGRALWKKVHVFRRWDVPRTGLPLGGKRKKPSPMYRVLEVAEEVTCGPSFMFDKKHLVGLQEMAGSQLTFLQLHHHSIAAAGLESLLSTCPRLKSLQFLGEPSGKHPVVVSHPNLENLRLHCRQDIEDRVYENRRQPKRHLIDHQQFGAGH